MSKKRYDILKEIDLIFLVKSGIISTFTLQKLVVYEFFKKRQDFWQKRGVKNKSQAVNDTVIYYKLSDKTIYSYINEMEQKV